MDMPQHPPEGGVAVLPLAQAGVKVRYMETNQGNGYLHHNKFMVFKTPQGESVFAGAGNFTGTAFSDNFENFYFLGKRTLVLSAKRWRICKFIRKKSLHRPRTLSPSVGPSTNCAFFLGLLAKEVNSTEIARSG